MMSFRGTRLAEIRLPLGTVWLLESLAESKGRQALYEKQSPQILKALRELALVGRWSLLRFPRRSKSSASHIATASTS